MKTNYTQYIQSCRICLGYKYFICQIHLRKSKPVPPAFSSSVCFFLEWRTLLGEYLEKQITEKMIVYQGASALSKWKGIIIAQKNVQ